MLGKLLIAGSVHVAIAACTFVSSRADAGCTDSSATQAYS
jgi:hypothetical protein